VAYQDASGAWRTVTPADWRRSPAAVPETIRGQNIIQVNYQDVANNTGVGFDAPDTGASRRNVMTQVLADLDALIADGGVLEIEVQASQTDGTGSLASSSTFYPTSPNGIHPGAALSHLTTGADPFPGVPDVTLTVDFGYNWNDAMDMPAANEVDLYSALIHELTHGLGLISLSDANGESVVSGGNPGVFSTFDNFLHTGAGADLWNAQGEFQGLASDLAGFDQGVEFRGSNASAVFARPPPLHTPDPYRQGASLVHWRSIPATEDAVMQPALRFGQALRTPLGWELAALRDLGYDIQAGGGDDHAFEFGSIEGSWLNPQTPGEGLFLDYGPSLDKLFVAWFTFTLNPDTTDGADADADVGDPEQRWLTALLEVDPASGTATGTLMSRQDGEFASPPQPGESNDPVGSISIAFASCAQAHVEYAIDTPSLSGGFDIEPLEKNVNPDGFTNTCISIATFSLSLGVLGKASARR